MKAKRLLWQIFLSYLVIIVVSLASVNWYTFRSVKHFSIKRSAFHLEEKARLIKDEIAIYLTYFDLHTVDHICKKLGEPSGSRLTVIAPSGEVVGDSVSDPATMTNQADQEEVRRALKGITNYAIRPHGFPREKNLFVAVPILQNNKVLAILRMALNIETIDEQISAIQSKIAIWGLMVASLAAGISWFISRRMTRPLDEMKKGADAFAVGDLSYRMPRLRNEEMGALAEAMNHMAAQLDERIQIIERQRNELEAILSSMVEGVIAVNHDEQVVNINPAAARMFFQAPFEAIGRSIQEVIRIPELHRFVKKALSAKRSEEGEVIMYHQDEHILYVHSSPLYDAKGGRIGALIVFNDITRLRKLENIRTDFAANVSHEIKTPLTAIRGFVETLRNSAVDDPEERDRFLGIIEKHVIRLSAIIDDLMHLSQIEQKGKEKRIETQKASLVEIVSNGVQICLPKADEKNIDIELHCEEDIVLEINAALIEQAVVNLLDNAIKYSGGNSSIHIRIRQVDHETIISFQDYGIGIAKQHLPRLFERFYRVDKARSRKLGGTGLGLAIVKHIAQSHGGYIDVESVLGKGSTFSLHLPNTIQ